MAARKLGLAGCVSMALGGMIGGGIFAVLGVVAQIVHGATWIAFVLAGLVAACAAYAFDRLNRICDRRGGSVTWTSELTGWSRLAGMTGWTLLFGYVGSMAMYAYAFGSFTDGFAIVPDRLAGLPTRPVVSVLVVSGFVALNLLGARSSGAAEIAMVGAKVLVLLALGLGGIAYGVRHDGLVLWSEEIAGAGPIMAAALSFVAFQGWQLLFYDQESIRDPQTTIRRAVWISIPSAVAIYVIVAITTVSLAPTDVIRSHPERALAVAADPFIPWGFTIISLAALFSTGSAINATLFSCAHFAKNLLSNDLLPDRLGDPAAEGLPGRTVVALGVVTAAFAAWGSLGAVTAFASLAFIVVFGGACALAFRERDSAASAIVPLAGAIGSVLFFALMFWHLFASERGTFYAVLGITAGALALELLYFERRESGD